MRSRLITTAACALAVATGALGTGGAAAAPSPALAWRTLRVGNAEDIQALPARPRAIAVVLHGGIARNRLRSALATRVAARVYANQLAGLGIGVLSVDYRWSAYGGGELRDVDAALARVARDPATARLPRIVIGASHGGYLAALAAATLPGGAPPLGAVVDLYGFSDLGATVSDRSSRYDAQARLTLRELGRPGRHRDAYAARSPLSLAGSLTAPVFQAVGSRDRETLPDVLALQRALRSHGRASSLRVIPGSAHGFAFGSAGSPLVWRGVASFLQRLGIAG